MKRYCVKIANFHFIVLSADYGDKICALLFLELERTQSASQNPESSHSTTISFSFLFVFFVLQSQGNIWRISCICAPFYTHTADSLTNPPSLFCHFDYRVVSGVGGGVTVLKEECIDQIKLWP